MTLVSAHYIVNIGNDFVRDHLASTEEDARNISLRRANYVGRALTNTVIHSDKAALITIIGSQNATNWHWINGRYGRQKVGDVSYWQVVMATDGNTNIVRNIEYIQNRSVWVKGYTQDGVNGSLEKFLVTGIYSTE